MTHGALTSHTLRDERSQLEATFLPGAGMLCSSLRHRGEELLAQNRGVQAYVERGKTMGIPLLYPWANRLAGFDYAAAGRTVAVPHDSACVALDDNGLPIHGVIGGRMRWELLHAAAAGPGGCALVAQLSWEESLGEPFEVFPFHHTVRYEARLEDGVVEIAVTVHAGGGEAVPVAFGFHPYLAPPGPPRERWRVRLPAMRGVRLDQRQIPLGPGDELPAQEFELGERQYDDGFDMVSERAHFAVQAGERRLALEFREGCRCAQVYAPRDGRFICFEPMTAPANALRSGDGLRVLAPGESCRAAFAVGCPPTPE